MFLNVENRMTHSKLKDLTDWFIVSNKIVNGSLIWKVYQIICWAPEGHWPCLKMFQLRTRRALLLYKVCSHSTLLVLNKTSLNSINALLALNQRSAVEQHNKTTFHEYLTSNFIYHVIVYMYVFLHICIFQDNKDYIGKICHARYIIIFYCFVLCCFVLCCICLCDIILLHNIVLKNWKYTERQKKLITSFRATLTKIYCIKINHIKTQIRL